MIHLVDKVPEGLTCTWVGYGKDFGYPNRGQAYRCVPRTGIAASYDVSFGVGDIYLLPGSTSETSGTPFTPINETPPIFIDWKQPSSGGTKTKLPIKIPGFTDTEDETEMNTQTIIKETCVFDYKFIFILFLITLAIIIYRTS